MVMPKNDGPALPANTFHAADSSKFRRSRSAGCSVGTKASRKARSFTSYNTNRLTPGGADSFNNRREMRNTFRKQCTTTAKKKQHVAPSGDKEPNYNTHTSGRERRHRPPSGARDKQLHNPTIEDLSRNPLTSHLVNCINFDNTFHGERKKKDTLMMVAGQLRWLSDNYSIKRCSCKF